MNNNKIKNFRTSVQVGDKYNMLTAISYEGKNKHGKYLFRFRCDCGNEKVIIGTEVKNGYSKSCGCYAIKVTKKVQTKHGKCGTKVYYAWRGLKTRCDHKSYDNYHRYGGRGITYDPRWSDFEEFYKDMGEPPTSKHELDRIDNNGNYTKDNCRWVLHEENCNNRKEYESKSGYTGIFYREKTKRYLASFCVKRKNIYVGSFGTLEEAYEARKNAIMKYNSEHGTKLKVS